MKSTKMSASIFIGVVVEVADNWLIKFRVPNIIDNLEVYPTALPLNNHNYQLYKDDEVMIFSTLDTINNQFYYLPITHYKFTGSRYKNSFTDYTKENIIDEQSPFYYGFYNNYQLRINNSCASFIDQELRQVRHQVISIPGHTLDKYSDEVNKALDRDAVDKELDKRDGERYTIIYGTDYYYLTGYHAEEYYPTGSISISNTTRFNECTREDQFIKGNWNIQLSSEETIPKPEGTNNLNIDQNIVNIFRLKVKGRIIISCGKSMIDIQEDSIKITTPKLYTPSGDTRVDHDNNLYFDEYEVHTKPLPPIDIDIEYPTTEEGGK